MYHVEVTWLDKYKEKDIITHMFIIVSSYKEAMRYISQNFHCIESVKIEEVDSEERHIVYIPKDAVQQIKEENLY